MRLESANIPEFEAKQLDLPDPEFLHYKPDFNRLKNLWKRFGGFKNFLIVGNGGSITTALGIDLTLAHDKTIKFLSTVDPDYIAKLKKMLPVADTLVIAVSKAGETVTQLESLMHFTDYQWLVVTSKGTTLEQMAQKLGAEIVQHPPLGGRFTGLSEVALVPAILCGVDIESLWQGAHEYYQRYEHENIALKAAQIFYSLEQQGIVDVFLPFYSHQLYAFNNLIVQLCHESFGKDGKGQTYFAHEAPESQHHTNQRFFGGRKNIAGFFVTLEKFNHDTFTNVPASMHSIHLKDGSLYDLHKIPLTYAMHSEFRGTWEDAKIHGIPIVSLSVDVITPKEIGAFIAFWQMFAVYSSVLRGVNPFDQPQVESSKAISWNKRKEFKKQ